MSRRVPNLLPSLEELRRLFDYDSKTGVISWRIGSPKRMVGEEAGCTHHGYRMISLGGRENRGFFHAHRIAWKMFYEEEPPLQIDHIDRNRSNNCIKNLRAASESGNSSNKNLSKNNKSGCAGVSWNARNGKWRVHVSRRYIGAFENYDVAVSARMKYAAETFGEFSPHS